jgi:hypothetical protein
MDTQLDGLFVVNRVVDLLFVIDMAAQFFIVYEEEDDIEFKSAEVREHSRIVRHYIKGWFTIDLLGILPFDIWAVATRAGDEEGVTWRASNVTALPPDVASKLKIVRVVRLLRLLKLLRILRASRLFTRFESRMSVPWYCDAPAHKISHSCRRLSNRISF